MKTTLSWDEFERHFLECGIEITAGPGVQRVPVIRTDRGDHHIAAVWKDDMNQIIIDMGRATKP